MRWRVEKGDVLGWTPSSVFSSFVSILYSTPSLFCLISATFSTCSLVEGHPICKVYTCFHPMITSQIFANRYPCKNFVKICKHVLYAAILILVWLLSTRSLAKKKRILICIQLPVHNFFPFFNLYFTLLILKQDVLLHVISLRSHVQTNTDVVWQLINHTDQFFLSGDLMFSFCLLDLQCTIPYPNNIKPFMWIFRSWCTPYSAQTHVHNWIIMYAPMIIVSSIVCFRYCNIRLDLYLSSLVLLITLVHSKDIAVSMSVFSLFDTHSGFETIDCRISASFFSVIVELSSIFCKPLFASDYTVALSSSPRKPVCYLM